MRGRVSTHGRPATPFEWHPGSRARASPGRADARKARSFATGDRSGTYFSRLFSPFRLFASTRATPYFRILAPYFSHFSANPKRDLKRPLTIFDETAKKKRFAIRAGCQEDSGALRLGVRRLRTDSGYEGQGPTWVWEVPKQARIRHGSLSGGEDKVGPVRVRNPHFSA